jgi:methionyl-tRNA formyltransferase
VALHAHGRGMLDRLLDGIARTGAMPEGRTTEVLPYCPFPDRAMLSALRRRGLRLTDRHDLRDALSLSAKAG